MLESRADRSGLGAAPDIAAVVDVDLNFPSPTTAESHEQKTNTISAQETRFDFALMIYYQYLL